MTRISSRINQKIAQMLLAGISGTLLASSAHASSFGFQSGLAADNFPIGVHFELDTDPHSSVGFGLTALTSVNVGYKYFWNSNNHSGLFTEASVGTLLALPSVTAYVQQGYRWVFDSQVELEIKGGLGILGAKSYFDQPIYSTGNSSYYSYEPTWRFAPLPSIGMRLGFRF
jgi:hypothetical protein